MTRILLRASALALLVPLFAAACSGDAVGAYNATGLGGGPPCSTCSDVFVNGGITCGPGPSVDAWQALENCACAGPCESACTQSFCVNKPVDQGCGTCMQASCTTQWQTCTSN
jgi:hypothetical protein